MGRLRSGKMAESRVSEYGERESFSSLTMQKDWEKLYGKIKEYPGIVPIHGG